MTIDGYTGTLNVKAMNKELHAIGRNINQIPKRFNSASDLYRGSDQGQVWTPGKNVKGREPAL